MDNRILKSHLRTLTFQCLVLVCTSCFLLITAYSAIAEEQGETFSLSGVVKEISLVDRTLVVEPEEERKQRLFFTDKTLYKGVAGASEIKVKHKVRIWYVRENKLLKAVKIKVMPELGC